MTEQDLKTIFKVAKASNERDYYQAFNDEEAFKAIDEIKRRGDYKGKGRAKWRQVAYIHPALYHAAKRIFGDQVFQDKRAFKELMKRPEMQPFLTVPISEL